MGTGELGARSVSGSEAGSGGLRAAGIVGFGAEVRGYSWVALGDFSLGSGGVEPFDGWWAVLALRSRAVR